MRGQRKRPFGALTGMPQPLPSKMVPLLLKPPEGLGVTRQQLYRVIKGECAISPEMAVRLEHGIGSSAATWLKMQMNYDLARIQKNASAMTVKRLKPKEAA